MTISGTLEPLSDCEWGFRQADFIDWLAGRAGWEDVGLAFEYVPSRPPCHVTIPLWMELPCRGTVISTDLEVSPPRVEFWPNFDIFPNGCLGDIKLVAPLASQVTGLPDDHLTGQIVSILGMGLDHPDNIRRQIETVESWRWPDRLPQPGDRWVADCQSGVPADLIHLDRELANRGWVVGDLLEEGDLLLGRKRQWHPPGPQFAGRPHPQISVDPAGGYLLTLASGGTPVASFTAAQLIYHLDSQL